MPYSRKVIRIRAEDSPNVREKRDDAIPGVLSYSDYLHRRATWDQIRQCIGLDAQFYEGEEVMLFPPVWLAKAKLLGDNLEGTDRQGLGMGVDPAEGGDKTAWCIVDRQGVIHLESQKTPDTSVIVSTTIALMRRFNMEAIDVMFDRGGGGKQHADIMRQKGYEVRTVAFGEGVTQTPGVYRNKNEERFEYVNRRAQMYGELREILTPNPPNYEGFGIPSRFDALHQQLSPIPLMYDQEGRITLPPKNRPPAGMKTNKRITLVELIGHSPDEADALVMAVHSMLHKPRMIGAIL